MKPKELLRAALRGEKTPRPAWVPFVGVHGGSLLETAADEYLLSSDLMVQGLEKAASLYRPDGLPVLFDLQVEAEILGCGLRWAKDAPPAVCSHPLTSGTLDDLPELSEEQGRFPIVIDVLERLKASIGDEVMLYGLVCGPFTLALHLRGNDIFLDMYDERERVQELMGYCADVCKRAASIYMDHGVEVVAVVDPMTSQISPEHFETYVTPYVNDVFDHVRAAGIFSSLFVCGDASRNLEVMCRTRCDNISVDENISLELLRDLATSNGESFGGNLKLTTVLLLGNEQDAHADTVRCVDVGGNKGFVLAPGCDLPYDVPPSNLQAVAELVHDPYKLDVARTASSSPREDLFEDVEVPDYEQAQGVFVDVITLDSTACAPCQYMVEAVQRVVKTLDIPVVVREHKIKTREGLGYMKRLGVGNLPTICIDGKPSFVSIIPDQPTLEKAIRDRAESKQRA